jgi:hypothetical protein
MFNFDSKFFEKHQEKLLYIANNKWFRFLLGLNRLPKEIKGLKIDKITPNSIHHRNKKTLEKNARYKLLRMTIEYDYLDKKRGSISNNDKNRQLKLIQLERETRAVGQYFTQKEYTAEFFTRPRFAEALAYNLSPFCYFQELRSQKFSWRFSPAGLAYILLFGLLGKFAGLPLAFMGTTTSYPTATGDGFTRTSSKASWADAHDATSANKTNYANGEGLVIYSYYYGGVFGNSRSFFQPDTSGLGSGATISDASLNLYCAIEIAVGDNDEYAYGAIVQTFQAATNQLEAADWIDNGSDNGTAGRANNTSIQTGGQIDLDTITLNNWFAITLDATGRSWINKTGVTKIGLREGHDLTNNSMANQTINSVYIRWSPYTGSTYDPYLSVTYTTATNWTQSLGETVSLADSVEKGNGKKLNDTNSLADNNIKTVQKNLSEGYVGSEGPNSPGTMADDATVGTVAWSNPDNAKVSDNVYATFDGSGTDKDSHYLEATNFGFSIPNGATINGIVVEIERKAQTSPGVVDNEVKIVKADGTIGTENKGLTSFLGNPWPTTDAYQSYGGSVDLWSETWTAENINDADFGAVLSVTTADSDPSVDHIRITVYYTVNGIQMSETISNGANKNIGETPITLGDGLIKSIDKNMADANNIVDQISPSGEKTQELNETINLVDTTEKETNKILNDNGNVSDTLANYPKKNIGDDVGLADSVLKSDGHNENETITLVDETKMGTGKALTDTSTLADELKKAAGKKLSENVQLLDLAKLLVGKNLTEALALIDNLVFYVPKELSISDNLAVTDDLSRQLVFYRSLVDTLPVIDSVAVQTAYKKAFGEIMVVGDIIKTEIQKNIGDNPVLNDLFTFEIRKSLAESINLGDTIERNKKFYRVIGESVSVGDDLKNKIGKYLSDSAALADIMTTATQFQRAIGEAVIVSDIMVNILTVVQKLDESVSLADSLRHSVSLGLNDNFIVTEILIKSFDKNIGDNVDITDLITKSIGYKLSISDTATIAETLIKGYNKSIGEALVIVDSLTKQLTRRFYKRTVIINRNKNKAILISPIKKVIFYKHREKKVLKSKPQ